MAAPRSCGLSFQKMPHSQGVQSPVADRLAEYTTMSLREQRITLNSLREKSQAFRSFDRRSSFLVYTALVGFTVLASAVFLLSFGLSRNLANGCATAALLLLVLAVTNISRRRESLIWAAIAAHHAEKAITEQEQQTMGYVPAPRTPASPASRIPSPLPTNER